jgi:regulator of sigma E protease
MNPFEDIDRTDPALFPNKSVGARFAVLFAGSAFNYIAASLLVFATVLVGGIERDDVAVVGEVTPGLPAAAAGLLPGDVVEQANGTAMNSIADVARVARERVDQPTEFRIRRGDETLTVSITPRLVPTPGAAPQPRIGIVAGHIYEPVGVAGAAWWAVRAPARFVLVQLLGIVDLVLHPRSDGLQSVVDMGASMAETAERGWRDYVSLLAAISIALAVFNLLPIPALDGGRIVFVLYEAITRRRPNERFEAVVHTAGLLLLLALVVAVNARSIYTRWAGGDPPPPGPSAPPPPEASPETPPAPAPPAPPTEEAPPTP